MNENIKNDDVIFNFFKQICDEKVDKKCIDLGESWLRAMETNLSNIENNLQDSDKIKHKENINKNKKHLDGLKGKTAPEWREYATQCMIEILDHKTKS